MTWSPTPLTRRALLGGLGLAGLAGAGLLWHHRPARWRSGFTVHLLPPEDPSGCARGVHWVVQVCLESLAEAFVVPVSNPALHLPPRQRAFQLQLRPGREGQALRLDYRWRRENGAWQEVRGTPLPPAAALAAFLTSLPEPVDPGRHLATYLPPTPAGAWELFELASRLKPFFQLEGVRPRLDRLLAQAPRSALVWCLFGTLGCLELEVRRDWIPEDRALAENCLRQAQILVPSMPYAAGELAQMMSDFGENQAALTVLASSIRRHPHSERLLRRLAYSARNAGLMEVARLAVQARERWMGSLKGVENTLLYLGEVHRFERAIELEGELEKWIPAHRFYLGYSAFARGDRETALVHLRKSRGNETPARFGQLERVLLEFLEDHRAESLRILDELVQQHLSIRTPDGEFILKLAEMMALHGQNHRALDLAVRAASHGFGCLLWYERSPFLGPIRQFRRFQALLETLRERQDIYLKAFSPGTFGL